MKWIDYREKLGIGFSDSDKAKMLANNVATFIKNPIISNLLIFGTLIQTISITRLIYKLTNSKYGYEEYMKNKESTNLA